MFVSENKKAFLNVIRFIGSINKRTHDLNLTKKGKKTYFASILLVTAYVAYCTICVFADPKVPARKPRRSNNNKPTK